MTPITVIVTDDDIANGVPLKECWCPVARAVCRALGMEIRTANCTIGPSAMIVDNWRAKLPSAVRRFVVRFDSGLPVKPFSFTVEVPDDYARLAVR